MLEHGIITKFFLPIATPSSILSLSQLRSFHEGNSTFLNCHKQNIRESCFNHILIGNLLNKVF